jgi:hypothetical protein
MTVDELNIALRPQLGEKSAVSPPCLTQAFSVIAYRRWPVGIIVVRQSYRRLQADRISLTRFMNPQEKSPDLRGITRHKASYRRSNFTSNLAVHDLLPIFVSIFSAPEKLL